MNTLNNLFKIPDEYINVAHHYRKEWVAKKAKSIKKGLKVLDAGAGECPYRKLFDHCDYRTQDFGRYDGTTQGPQKENWHYGNIDYECDITQIPVRDNYFDAILCTEVLEHVPYPIEVIKEFSRILKKGGKLFITAPLASGLHQEPYHYYGGYTPHFYRKFLGDSGFIIDEISPEGGLFKHVAQEVHRCGRLINERNGGLFSPLYHSLLMFLIPRYLGSLDKRFSTPEFTIGYLVAATKK